MRHRYSHVGFQVHGDIGWYTRNRPRGPGGTPYRPQEILEAGLRVCEMTMSDLVGRERGNGMSLKRMAIIAALYELCDISFIDLARLVGRRGHSMCHCAYTRFLEQPAEVREWWLVRIKAQADATRRASMIYSGPVFVSQVEFVTADQNG